VIATSLNTGTSTSIETDGEGRFRLALEPGSYEVSIEVRGDLPSAKPQRVTVHAGEFTDVTVAVDTGIR
jgi:Carboxypeptidase regulatory-like domain